jgi:hypothetical protein
LESRRRIPRSCHIQPATNRFQRLDEKGNWR